MVWYVTGVFYHLNLTFARCGAGVDLDERLKYNHYIDLKLQYKFTLLAFQAFGSMYPETELFVDKERILGN